MADCCLSSGGTVSITVCGQVLSPRGSVSLQFTRFNSEAGSNLDGSTYITRKPEPPKADFSISDRCGLRISDLDKFVCCDAVIELEEVGRTFILIEATLIGRPSLDPATGEISGMSLVGSRVREINA